jgi:carbonic anhydrase
MVGFLLSGPFTLEADTKQSIGADEALKKLMDGNASYVSNRLTLQSSSGAETRRALAKGQQPYAIILSCSDSRVPPEIIFDKGLGEIFVVRVAGNVPDPIIIGSVEYAVEHLGSPLIMVLGHGRCGAVQAAVEAGHEQQGNIGAIINKILPAVRQAEKKTGSADKSRLVETAVEMNAQLTAKALTEQSSLIRSLVDSGKLKIVAAKYDLDDGTVKLLGK